jgi:endonuclease/exonuclease/phosphatase family metal-dependent hydrolase/membrane protein CcdC involved in cytochrome C biogenesis
MNQSTQRLGRLAGILEASAVALFLYQALRVLFSVLFGVVYDTIYAGRVPMSTAGLLLGAVILALLAPVIAPRQPGPRRAGRLVAALVVFLARIPLTLNDPQQRLAAALIIVAGAGIYLATRFREAPWDIMRALVLGLVFDQVLRAFGHTYDVTLRPSWWFIQVGLSLALCLLALGVSWKRMPVGTEAPVRPGLLGGLAWGGWLFLETSLLAFPNAVARWSGVSYAVAAPLLLAVTLLMLMEGGRWAAAWGRPARIASSLLLLACLAAGYLLSGPIAFVSLLVAQCAALILLPHCFPLHEEGQKDLLGLSLCLGGIIFLLLDLAYGFAFSYAYTAAFLRDTGLYIFLVAGILAGMQSLRRSFLPDQPTPLLDSSWAGAFAVSLIMLVTFIVWPRAPRPPADGGQLRAATYNVHYGYNTDWHLSLEAQAKTIEASGADVVAVQEVDTGRPTSYMIDDALWLGQRLGMDSVYLPTVEHLTGITLLSRYPVLDARTLLLPSHLEQTGVIWASLDVGGVPVNAFAIWLGLTPAERARQLDAALPFLAAHPGPAVFGGDFNATPDTPVYARIQDASFEDPFLVLGLSAPPTSPSTGPYERLDYVWLRDVTPVDAQVPVSLASDHRPVVVEATLP